MADQIPVQPNETSEASALANSRLEEFPGDPLSVAGEVNKEARLQEMENWSNGIGAHTERLATRHAELGRHIIETARETGEIDVETAKRELVEVPKMTRTGVKVDTNLTIEVHKGYPFSGDSPAGGKITYRAPKDIPIKTV